jgi:hypothetical protein
VRSVLELRWQTAGNPETGFVFPAPTKSCHIEHWTVKKQHRATLRRSGVRPFLLYSLRHTFATRIAPHVDPWTLCKVMGWASLSVAMHYIHPEDERLLAVFSRSEGKGGHVFGHAAQSTREAGIEDDAEVISKSGSYMVSAAGFEPATHALKGHCSTN